jgi:D-beta-D-heptose 7-phosphate kinase/D-beta-D-heptose 1-phosphate adenosyltransferase
MAEGNRIEEAVQIANTAAGIVVSKLGTTPIEHLELVQALHASDDKLISLDLLLKKCLNYRNSGKRVIFTNGCFDILHRGHVQYLKQARTLGDVLIVGLNSDRSVQQLKGPTRPINHELDRAVVLGGLESVSHVVIFDEETPHNLLSAVRPDILVKGGDYKREEVVGREFAGHVEIIPFVDGFSTTGTLHRMKEGL